MSLVLIGTRYCNFVSCLEHDSPYITLICLIYFSECSWRILKWRYNRGKFIFLELFTNGLLLQIAMTMQTLVCRGKDKELPWTSPSLCLLFSIILRHLFLFPFCPLRSLPIFFPLHFSGVLWIILQLNALIHPYLLDSTYGKSTIYEIRQNHYYKMIWTPESKFLKKAMSEWFIKCTQTTHFLTTGG